MCSFTEGNNLLHILHRACAYLLRKLSKLFQYVYVLLLAAPVLLIKRSISLPFKVVSGHGAVMILCDRVVAKVASSPRSTVLTEFANAQRMSRSGTVILACTPSLRLYRNALVTCLISERYQNVPIVDALDCAVEVRRNFDCAGLKQGGASLARYPQLRAGLRQVAELFGDDVSCRMEESVRQYLADGVYHTGLCHGDFHFRNIMRDNKGHVRVIDLDCVRFEGVVELDAVYFALEMEWSASGDLWLETLATAFEHGGDNIAQWLGRFSVCWNEALGLVYFLDRVGQENINYGFKYSKMKMERAVAAMQRADHGMIDREQV